MKHSFVWKIPATEPQRVQSKVWDAMERAMTFDRNISNATVVPGEGHVLVRFQYQGRDRWFIYKRARYAMVAVMVRAKLPPKNLELVALERVAILNDRRKPNRTEPQQIADYNKTTQARWDRWKAQQTAT